MCGHYKYPIIIINWWDATIVNSCIEQLGFVDCMSMAKYWLYTYSKAYNSGYYNITSLSLPHVCQTKGYRPLWRTDRTKASMFTEDSM